MKRSSRVDSLRGLVFSSFSPSKSGERLISSSADHADTLFNEGIRFIRCVGVAMGASGGDSTILMSASWNNIHSLTVYRFTFFRLLHIEKVQA